MKKIVAVGLMISFATGSALAQTSTPPANSNPSTPAVTDSNSNNAGAPAKGANSFTESQAKSRIEAKGFTDVSALTKDSDGVWRGTGTKSGKTMNVGLDYQGNVVAE